MHWLTGHGYSGTYFFRSPDGLIVYCAVTVHEFNDNRRYVRVQVPLYGRQYYDSRIHDRISLTVHVTAVYIPVIVDSAGPFNFVCSGAITNGRAEKR
jgi:hypothetical protein